MEIDSSLDLCYISEGCYKRFGNPYQIDVYNSNELYDLIRENDGINPCFISVCQYDPEPLLGIIPFDFDGSSSFNDVIKIMDVCEKFNLGSFIVVYSGGGYHFYLKVVEHHYEKDILRKFQSNIIHTLNLSSADYQIVGDIKRLMRIPNTINEKYGVRSRIMYSYNTSNIIDLYLWENDSQDSYSIHKYIENNDYSNLTYNDDDNLVSELHYYPCLSYWTKSIEPPHLIRAWYVIMKIIQGLTDDEIVEDLKSKNWKDWNENYTRYQINFIRKGKYRMPKCSTIKKYGYCNERLLKCRSKT